MKDSFGARVNLLYGIVFLLACALAGRLIFVQIVKGSSFSERAEGQYVSPVSNLFERGSIFFQTKNGIRIGAATLKTGFTVALHPSLIEDSEKVFEKLSLFIPDLDVQSFFLKASKKDDPYEEIAWKIGNESADAIQALKIPGVSIHSEKWRFYPGGSLASHALGFVGFKGEDFGGRYGVERYYDDILQRDSEELYVNFFAEVFANIEHSLFYRSAREGDIVLAIEPEVERTLEKALRTVALERKIDGGGAIVMNPKTGSIYAIAAEPSFDPNHFGDEKNYEVFSNPTIERVFEMGSIIKPLTIATGIDSGVITRESTYYDAGSVMLNGKEIHNYDKKARGTVSMQEVLNQSLNTGAVHVMQKVGKEKFAQYFLSFGLGEETGIDLPGEIPGLVKNLESTRDIEYATASFGQGIAVTPIAMVRALGALANGGIMVNPHVVDRVEYPLGSRTVKSSGFTKQVFKKETAEEVTRMLVTLVDNALLGGTVKLEHFNIAAKTGTAQMALPEGRGYYEDRFLHSFFGYFPAYDPQFLVFLYIVNPKGVRYASETLTLPFMDMAKFLLNYYEIPPDR